MSKNYHATTGVDEFYYAVLNTDTNTADAAPELVDFVQEISVNSPQSIERAYGSNKVAELATSNGPVEVTGQFHKLPFEDRVVLFGLETANGLSAYGNTDNPPYVVCVFAKTHEDGSKEWVGLPKGKFLKPSETASTKTDSTTFSSDSVTAEFMDREVTGFTEEKSVIFGRDEKGETTNRDALFQALFGQAYPETGVEEV